MKYNKTVSARISASDYNKLNKTGYSVRNAVEMFNKNYYKNREVMEIDIAVMEIEKKIKHHEKEKAKHEISIKVLEEQLDNCMTKLCNTTSKNNGKIVKNAEMEHVDEEKLALVVESTQEIYNQKRPFIDSVLDLPEPLFEAKAKLLEVSVGALKEYLSQVIA